MKVTAAAVVLVSTGGVLYGLQALIGLDAPASAAFSALYLVLFLAARRRVPWKTVLANPLIPTVAFALSSVGWSLDPMRTAQSALLFAATVTTGAVLAWLFPDSRQFLRMLQWVFVIIALLAIAAIYLAPRVGIHELGWRGLFPHKNHMGRVISLAVAVHIAAMLYKVNRRFVSAFGITSGAFLILGSRSATAMGMVLVLSALVVGTFLWERQQRHRGPKLLLLLSAATVALLLLTTTPLLTAVLRALGRDGTFTGRTLLWSVARQIVERRPLVGHGYRAIWGQEHPFLDPVAVAAHGWRPISGHNAALHVLVDLGWVGFLLLLGAVGLALARWIVGMRRGGGLDANLWGLVIVWSLVGGVSEATLAVPNQLFTVLFAWVLASQRLARERAPIPGKRVSPRVVKPQQSSFGAQPRST